MARQAALLLMAPESAPFMAALSFYVGMTC